MIFSKLQLCVALRVTINSQPLKINSLAIL